MRRRSESPIVAGFPVRAFFVPTCPSRAPAATVCSTACCPASCGSRVWRLPPRPHPAPSQVSHRRPGPSCATCNDIVLSEIVQSELAPPGRSALPALQRATHATLHLVTAELVDPGVTASAINALANLADGQGRTVSQLGASVGTRPTTLTSVLDRLERRGHITRGTRAGDRRSVL